MRLIDLAQPYLDGVHTIVEIAAGDLDLRPYLRDVGDVAYLRCDVSDPATAIPELGKGVLLVLATGPDPGWHLPPRVCRQVLEQVAAGGRGLVIFGYRGAELPYHQILDSLCGRRCQVLQAATLDYPDLPSGIAFAQAEDVQAPPDYFGRPVSTGDASLRIANEHVLAGFVWRGLRARYQDLQRARSTAGTAATTGTAGAADEAPPEQVRLAADNERLARALSDAEQRLGLAERRLAAVERSATMEVGRLFVAAVRHPWRGAVRLPRDLHATWRRRGGGVRRAGGGVSGAGGGVRTGGGVRLGGQAGGGADMAAVPGCLFAAPSAPGLGWRLSAPGRLVITGVLTPRTCATLDPDAAVHPLLPHYAAQALEGTGADIMLIDAAAALPGGPWSYLGDPAAADRGRRLADLIGIARSLGIPVVFLRTLPPHRAPGLEVFAERCDVAYDGDLGVQLARFNPVDLDPLRTCDAVYAGRRDPREPPAQRRLLDAVELAGARVAAAVPWHTEPTCYRRHGLFVTASARQAREQLACGARVIGPVGSAQPVGGAIHLTDAGAAAAAIAAAREQGVREPAEIRGVLRELFATHATPVRLAELAALAGVAVDPLASRGVAVLAMLPRSTRWDAAAERSAGRLASTVARQRHRPAEVVLATPDAAAPQMAAPQAPPGTPVPSRVPAWLRELQDLGIAVRVAREPGLAGAARAARSEWVVRWDTERDHPDTYLLDLVCARECSRADVVGTAADAGHTLEMETGCAFAPDLEPVLIRRTLVNSGELDAAAWARRGHTLFALSREALTWPVT